MRAVLEELQQISKSIANDLYALGIRSLADLKNKNSEVDVVG